MKTSIRQLKRAREWFADNPAGLIRVPLFPPRLMSREQWNAWFIDCLNAKINRGGFARY